MRKLTKNIKKMKRRDQTAFFQELGELLGSGYDIRKSLAILWQGHPSWQPNLTKIQAQLAAGVAFDQAVAAQVNPTIVVQLKLAQQHGNIEATLIILGKNLAAVSRQQGRLKQVLRYPLMLLALLGLMLLGLNYCLLPMMRQWQDQTSSSDPSSTNWLTWLLVGLSLVILALIYLWWRRASALQRVNWLARLPLIGALTKTGLTYQVSQQLALLLQSGLTIPEIVELMAKEPTGLGPAIARQAQLALKKGQTVEDFIWQQRFLQNALAGYFTRGHRPEVLADYLAYYAKLQYRQLMAQTDRLIGSLQPIFFGIVGLAIVGLYLSMLMPMYQNIGEINS
ncbi:type II secretion system F family protein [Lactobacillaceae bacterium L1_55_11]|nr:type II secretion system F family protein [Lactobacillaceae bacterium L1_55_11]